MSKRGSYVTIVQALFRGPDFQKLPATARWTFVCLKQNMSGAAGIDLCYDAEIVARLTVETGHPAAVVRKDLQALERAGWIRRQNNILWMIDHLTHDPHARSKELKKRTNVQRHVASLPRRQIVRDFIGRHSEWFPVPECIENGLAWALTDDGGLPEDSPPSPSGGIEDIPNNNTNNSTNTNTKRPRGEYSPEFLALWAEYPQRSGSTTKAEAAAQVEARLREGVSFEHLMKKTKEFCAWAVATGRVKTTMVMQAKRFYGESREYDTGDWTVPKATANGRPGEYSGTAAERERFMKAQGY